MENPTAKGLNLSSLRTPLTVITNYSVVDDLSARVAQLLHTDTSDTVYNSLLDTSAEAAAPPLAQLHDYLCQPLKRTIYLTLHVWFVLDFFFNFFRVLHSLRILLVIQ
jgi:hypothetical protein